MINFLEPSALERLRNAIAERPRIEPVARLLATALALMIALIGVESARLRQAQGQAVSRERERDQLLRRVATVRAELQAARSRQGELEDALELRKAGLHRAAQIARVGNILPHTIGLTTLRDAGEIWHLEGRAQAMDDVGTAIERVKPLLVPRVRRALSVHRERGERFVNFEIELGMGPP